jgi:hypothetical protein
MMANHPNRSKQTRTVALKIATDGTYVQVVPNNTSDLVTLVTSVPASVATTAVVQRLNTMTLLPMTGPWTISWDRLAGAELYSILKI